MSEPFLSLVATPTEHVHSLYSRPQHTTAQSTLEYMLRHHPTTPAGYECGGATGKSPGSMAEDELETMFEELEDMALGDAADGKTGVAS